MGFPNVKCQECGKVNTNHCCMFMTSDGLMQYEGNQICGIAVCALCSVKFGAEEGIFCCAKHGINKALQPVAYYKNRWSLLE
jgi:hypothetical protein